MEWAERLACVRFEGMMTTPKGDTINLFTDPKTGSSFDVRPGELIGSALLRFIANWAEAEVRLARLGEEAA
jgi:hypothetical protein